MERTVLTADEIFAAHDTEAREFVPCPEWGFVEAPSTSGGAPTRTPKGVFVRCLTLGERGKIRKEATVTKKDPRANGGTRDVIEAEKFEALIVVETAVDADGRRIFKPSHVESLIEKSGGPISRIAKVAMRLAGLNADDEAIQD